MKKLLIISPLFPPVNSADMQRIRMSLPYFKSLGWEPEVVTVDEHAVDMPKDERLLSLLPKEIKIHTVEAFSKKITSKFGLGSLALRSLWFYKRYVNQLLKKQHFDLIYFSTTQFPVCILGAYWKRKFNIPYVIDMQDPWHSNYYEDKPKAEKPPKYWFSYRLNNYLEPIAMKKVDGIISVSKGYIDTLKERYHRINQIPAKVITFGAYQADFALVESNKKDYKLCYNKENETFNMVYIGRGGTDMKEALTLLFTAFKKGLTENFECFDKIRFHFIGTSYAPNGQGKETIKPIAEEYEVSKYVNEQTDRISFYGSIYNLKSADAVIILGSNDKQYTASKIYPYILANKPIMAFFHPESSAFHIIQECNAGKVFSITDSSVNDICEHLSSLLDNTIETNSNWQEFEKYSAENMTKLQCKLFDQVITCNAD